MKKFNFTLQTVHKVRERRQEKESLELAKLDAEVEQAVSRVAGIEKMRIQTMEDYTIRLHSGEQMNSMEMELNSNHFASLNILQREAEQILKEKRQVRLRQLEYVKAAMQEVKVTDLLRENQKEKYQLDFARNEQTRLDELVSINFAGRLQKQ